MRLTKLLGVAVVLAALCSALPPLSARAEPATANTSQALQYPAGKFVQDLGNNAIAVMANKSLTPEQHTQQYRTLLQEAFGLQTIGRFVLGRAWNTATPEQQSSFMQLFEQLVLKNYGDRLNFYSGENFQVKGARPENDKDTKVTSEVLHTNGTPPTAIEWRVRHENSKMSIIDVVVEGVSQSVTQRQEYAAIIQRNNGNIDGLLDVMKQRVLEAQR